jgi:hypothetical protein
MEVQCLPHKKPLILVFELCGKVQAFLTLQKHKHAQLDADDKQTDKLAYVRNFCSFK